MELKKGSLININIPNIKSEDDDLVCILIEVERVDEDTKKYDNKQSETL